MSIEKVQFLKQSMTKRLSSVDSGWLSRCQVFDEVEEPREPVVGNSELTEKLEFLQPSNRSETPSKESKTASKTSVAESHLDPEETSSGSNVTLDAKPVSSEPDAVGVNHRNRELTAVTQSEEPDSVSVTKKSRTKARKSQDSDETPQVESKIGKKKGQKRRREDEEEVDESEEKKGGVEKKRRTKKGEAAGDDLPKKGGRRKGKAEDEDTEDPVSEKKTKIIAIPQENLLGEVDEEETRAAYRMKNTVSVK